MRNLRKTLIYLLLIVVIISCSSEEVKTLNTAPRPRFEEVAPSKSELPRVEVINSVTPKGKTYKNSLGIEFVQIPAGEFQMGCSKGDTECSEDEKPLHTVKISKSFYMGKYEVTQGQWKKVMGTRPSNFGNCGEDCPVELVSWEDAQEFIGKLSEREKQSPCKYRLPTEAEWEYSARAGGSTRSPTGGSKYYWGDTINEAYLWYDVNSENSTHPVGKKKPNAWGLYDMSGNVWEWVGDWYDSDYYKNTSINDPKGPNSGGDRILRGCSWLYEAKFCRLSNRLHDFPDNGEGNRGFRLLLVP
jgi:formylglycine-generating enzyme required for sulfatase activity